MENKELLHFILGYLFEINKLDKIPSKKLKRVKKFITEFEKEPTNNEKLFEDNDYSNESKDSLMDSYNYDNDIDQQNPHFW